MDGVNDDGDAGPVRCQSPQDAGFGAMGVDDVGFDAADEAADVAVCGGVAKGVYLAAEGVDDVKGEAAAAGALYELTFGPDGAVRCVVARRLRPPFRGRPRPALYRSLETNSSRNSFTATTRSCISLDSGLRRTSSSPSSTTA